MFEDVLGGLVQLEAPVGATGPEPDRDGIDFSSRSLVDDGGACVSRLKKLTAELHLVVTGEPLRAPAVDVDDRERRDAAGDQSAGDCAAGAAP